MTDPIAEYRTVQAVSTTLFQADQADPVPNLQAAAEAATAADDPSILEDAVCALHEWEQRRQAREYQRHALDREQARLRIAHPEVAQAHHLRPSSD